MRVLLALLVLLLPLPAAAAGRDMSDFRQIPVLNEGRVKPLESFARSYLIVMSGKTKAGDLSAAAWLAETLFDQESAYKRPLFLIADPRLRDALELAETQGNRYSFLAISDTLTAHEQTIRAALETPEEKLSDQQRALVNLYYKTLAYAEISRSLSLALPMNEKGQTYLDTGKLIGDMGAHRNTRILRVIPPLWEADGDLWFSPWQVLVEGRSSPAGTELLREWQNLATTYNSGDEQSWQEQAEKVKTLTYDIAGNHANKNVKALEVVYHNLNLLKVALVIYIGCFIMLLISFFSGKTNCRKIVFGLMSGAAIMQAAAIVMRMIIMARPPVATLYETTIFVSLIAVILCLIFEARRKDGMALLTASIIGAVLLFISTRYAADGDTMQMLVAVLDTNFWLATHVVTITMGYGATLSAGCLAHLYLIRAASGREGNMSLLKTVMATGLVAMFFSILGTILGGIWADQSWGRFWGWDPKENGAMLICLWLLFCFHGRLTGQLSPLWFAALMALGNIIVALAWFGVNLLSVGLHSYGFTQGIALALGTFCVAELILVGGLVLLAKRKGA